MTDHSDHNLKTQSCFYNTNVLYSITLNPHNNHQFHGHEKRYRRFRNYMYQNLLSLHGEYEIFIEYSEPRGMQVQGRTGPRLHAHGTLLFKSKKDLAHFLMTDYYKLLRWTSVDIDICSDPKVWYNYCTKQKLHKSVRLSNYIQGGIKNNSRQEN